MSLPELLRDSFHSSSFEKITQASNTIQAMYLTQEFYSQCINIITNESFDLQIKSSALLNFTNGVKRHWSCDFSPELKQMILSSFPDFAACSPPQMLRSFEKLSDELVKLTFFSNEWPNLFTPSSSILTQLIPQPDVGHIRSGLMLMKSTCKLIKNPTLELQPFYIEFTKLSLPLLAYVCQNCSDIKSLTFTYHCISRLLYLSLDKVKDIIQPFYLGYFMLFMQLANPEPSLMTEDKIIFLIKGVKFLSRISSLLNNAQIMDIFALLKQFYLQDKLYSLKGKSIGLLNTIIVIDKRYQMLEQSIQQIMEMIFSQLMLSDEDISLMEEDPVEFVQSNPMSCPNWEDPKAACCRLLSNCIKKCPKIVDFIYQVAFSMIQTNSRAQIFTAFRLLSTAVSKKCKNHITQFLPTLIGACNSGDFVIRCGGFYVLPNVSKLFVTKDMIQMCVLHMADPSPLVSYYASLSLSQLLYLAQKQEDYAEIRQTFADKIEQMYTTICGISTQFNDSYVSESLSTLVIFFGDLIFPYANSLFEKIIAIFVSACMSSDVDNLSNVETTASDAMLILIKIVGKTPQTAMELYPVFYGQIIQAFGATQSSQSVEQLFPLISTLINLSPVFDQSFWALLTPLMEIISSHNELDMEDIYPIMEQLIYRDNDLVSKPQVIVDICTLLFNDSVENTSSVFASLIMRCGASNLPCIPALIEVLNMAAAEFTGNVSMIGEAICNIFSAICLTSDSFPEQFVQIWISQHSFPFYAASLLKIFDRFNNNAVIQAEMLLGAFRGILKADDDDDDDDNFCDLGDDDDDDDLIGDIEGGNDEDELFDDFQTKPGDFNVAASTNPKWFDDNALVQQFRGLLINLKNSGSQALQALAQQIGPDRLGQCLQLLDQYPNHKKNMKDFKL